MYRWVSLMDALLPAVHWISFCIYAVVIFTFRGGCGVKCSDGITISGGFYQSALIFIIVPNHSAEDIYRFEEPGKGRGEFYLRQIIGTVNYKTGSDRIDFLHGWLNYQVEHHLFPSLPLNHYQEMQPIVKEICKKHNLPYRQEGVFKRAWMTIELMVGKSSQLVIRHA